MTITTYETLQTNVALWLNREDLTAVIPTFIQLAEAKFNREIRTRDMLTRATATSDAEFVALPDDFLENYMLEFDMTNLSMGPPLNFIGPDEAKMLKAHKTVGPSRYYTIIDGAFELIPAPTADLDLILTYYAKIPALETADTNWLLLKSPDLYLYGTLIETVPYLKDDERLPTWVGIRQKLLDDMNLESERSMRPTTQVNARRRSF